MQKEHRSVRFATGGPTLRAVGDQDLHEVTSGSGDFRAVTERVGQSVVVALYGDVDLLTSSAARATVKKAVPHARRVAASVVVVDLSGVTFFSSHGLQTLLELDDAASRDGVQLRVVASTHLVVRLLQVTGFDQILTVLPTRELALSGQ